MLPTRALARARGREGGGRGAGAGEWHLRLREKPGKQRGCCCGTAPTAAEPGGRTVGTATAVKGQPWARLRGQQGADSAGGRRAGLVGPGGVGAGPACCPHPPAH